MYSSDIATLRQINRSPALDETQVLTRSEIDEIVRAPEREELLRYFNGKNPSPLWADFSTDELAWLAGRKN
jgi:hypothetical protein